MKYKSDVLIFVLGLVFFVAVAGATTAMAQAQQDSLKNGQQIMTPVNASSVPSFVKKKKNPDLDNSDALINAEKFGLNRYKAVTGDLSVCEDNKDCEKQAIKIRSWICAASICSHAESNQNLSMCFGENFNQLSTDVQEQIRGVMCTLIKSPGVEGRQALLKLVPFPEDGLVENGAYLMALNGTAAACENYIKDYVGPYGPQWNFRWFRAMSGCRILARERTPVQEQNDFRTWFIIGSNTKLCSSIINTEMRNACQAPGVTDPADSSAS